MNHETMHRMATTMLQELEGQDVANARQSVVIGNARDAVRDALHHIGVLRADPMGHGVDDPFEADSGPDAIETAADTYLSLMERCLEDARNWDDLQGQIERHEIAGPRIDRITEEARLQLIRSIIDADPKPLPGVNEWCYRPEPFWSVECGGRLLVLSKTQGTSTPDTMDELIKSLTLTIIPAPSPDPVAPTPPPEGEQDDEAAGDEEHQADPGDFARWVVEQIIGHHKAMIGELEDCRARRKAAADERSATLFDRWATVLDQAEDLARQAVALAVVATDEAFDLGRLEVAGEPYPLTGVQFRNELVLTWSGPDPINEGIELRYVPNRKVALIDDIHP